MAPKAKPKVKAKAEPKAKPKAEPKSAKAKGKAKAAPAAAPSKKRAEPDAPAPGAEPEEAPKAPKAAKTFAEGDALGLAPLFEGSGYGAEWEAVLRPVIESLPDAGKFIGPSRDKKTVPVRELTFQALKPNPPGGWKVVSFGQSPFPRVESATGIAHFDNAITSWEDSRFGSVVTMRCIIKAAAMSKYGVPFETKTPELRALLKEKSIVPPVEWFQAMLTQGVLFLNAALTLVPAEGRAGEVVKAHQEFWRPVVQAIVEAILAESSKQKKGIVFAWWGSESLKTKKWLKPCFDRHPGAQVTHIDHKNPAAMADAFCHEPNIFSSTNAALEKFGHSAIDWLPSTGWDAGLGEGSNRMGAFIEETRELHKMYLERLRDGLGEKAEEIADITGIAELALPTLAEACEGLSLARQAEASIDKARKMKRGKLTEDQAGAIHLYTTNALYRQLNAALRAANRAKVMQYFPFLALLISALDNLPTSDRQLYRGVGLDLGSQYPKGSEITWWSVSSCTPELKVAKGFAASSKVSTIFTIDAIRSSGIREFSQYKNEEEFVLPPGAQFRVENSTKTRNTTEIHLKQLDRPCRVR